MRFKETQIITFANQKGGCGKTSSAVSVAAAFAASDYSVCLVDTDSQCNTTDTLGIDPDEHIHSGHPTLADIYLKRMPASEVAVEYGERFHGSLRACFKNGNNLILSKLLMLYKISTPL